MEIKSTVVKTNKFDGFTLVEVLVSVSLISMVGIYFISAQIDSAREKMLESVAQDVLTLANSSMAYFSAKGYWPDNASNCGDVVGVLSNANAFPVGAGGYVGPNGATISTTCASGGSVGDTLRITVTFPAGGVEDADMLMGYLPTSSKPSPTSTSVTHYVAAPRHAAGLRYNFHKLGLDTGGIFWLDKPPCSGSSSGGNSQQYFLIPQLLCVPGGGNGLGGYYFKELNTSTTTRWHLQLFVANGNNTSSGQFYPIPGSPPGNPPTCDNVPVTVGAITYCD